MIVLLLGFAGCAESPPTKASTETTLDLQITLPDAIDAVTLDGSDVPIVPYSAGRLVDPTAVYPSYEDALAASPRELVFLAQGQPMFVGHMQAGACQDVCAHLQCADMSKFTIEHVGLSARNFAAKDYDSALCTGPSGNIGATP
jgi:hypothetical protein